MFTREEAKELNTLFWTSFGKYMQKHKSQFSFHNKWVNYKTGVKDIYFRLKMDKQRAEISIELQHKDEGIRQLFFEQFGELRKIFEQEVGQWEWIEHELQRSHEGIYAELSAIRIQLYDVNLYNKDTWQQTFYFFEDNIVKLDVFWADFSELFKQLE
jgi:hypothetical protein